MSKKVKNVVFPLIIVVMLLLSSCIMPAETEVVEETESPIIITDVIGREVTLEKPAEKLVGTHNPTMNAAVVLGGGGKYLVGFGNKDMSRGLYDQVIDSYDDLAQIGKGSNINFEVLLLLGLIWLSCLSVFRTWFLNSKRSTSPPLSFLTAQKVLKLSKRP
jgi:iron complex transport system substrate-binding protein